MQSLPPLNAIRAFEAAARNRSFSRAAKELHVTQGAISRHIKTLEHSLNCQLFLRHPQGVELTDAAEQLLPDLTASFERIGEAIRRTSVGDREIRIISAPTLAIRWLMPQLQKYQDQNPDIRITTGWFKSSHDEFFDGGFDIGIDCESFSARRPEGLETIYLIGEALLPVCSPAYLDSVPAIREPADLLQCKLIHPSPLRWDWRIWFEQAGVDPAEAKQETYFETEEMAISAAIAGMGMAVVNRRLIRSELGDGRLVAPIDYEVNEGTGYYLFTARGRLQERKIGAFVDWLLQQARAEQAEAGPG